MILTALDTNIVSALLSREASTVQIAARLENAKRAGTLVISGVVFAELLAHPTMPADGLRTFLDATRIEADFELSQAMWTTAGERYARYAQRRRTSTGQFPRRLLADFLIGAHALRRADQLLTLDPRRYAQDFPGLHLATVSLA